MPGINAVLYYAPQIFQSFGFTSVTTDLLATGVTGCFQIVFTLPAVLFLDNFGRKTFLIVGAIGMCICHVIVAAVDGSFESDWSTHTSAGWASVAFIWLFCVNFAYSWGPVAWVLTQEIFPNSMRSRGVSIVASTNWMFNFIIGLTTKDMLGSMKFGTYIFFAAFCGGGAVFVWLMVPESGCSALRRAWVSLACRLRRTSWLRSKPRLLRSTTMSPRWPRFKSETSAAHDYKIDGLSS
jgi:hypothetical protein